MRFLVKTVHDEFLVVGAQEKQESPTIFETHFLGALETRQMQALLTAVTLWMLTELLKL